jgi:hypothetical protein
VKRPPFTASHRPRAHRLQGNAPRPRNGARDAGQAGHSDIEKRESGKGRMGAETSCEIGFVPSATFAPVQGKPPEETRGFPANWLRSFQCPSRQDILPVARFAGTGSAQELVPRRERPPSRPARIAWRVRGLTRFWAWLLQYLFFGIIGGQIRHQKLASFLTLRMR